MRSWFCLFLLTIALPALALANDAPPERPDSLPVFRAVLDGNPRLVVIPLHRDMLLAYDTGSCTLHKAWTGSVGLREGRSSAEGPVYLLDRSAGAWFTGDGVRAKRLTPRFLGYRLRAGRVMLAYELVLDGETYFVEEYPSYTQGAAGAPQLLRRFKF